MYQPPYSLRKSTSNARWMSGARLLQVGRRADANLRGVPPLTAARAHDTSSRHQVQGQRGVSGRRSYVPRPALRQASALLGPTSQAGPRGDPKPRILVRIDHPVPFDSPA